MDILRDARQGCEVKGQIVSGRAESLHRGLKWSFRMRYSSAHVVPTHSK
jgi:hypothetical protein